MLMNILISNPILGRVWALLLISYSYVTAGTVTDYAYVYTDTQHNIQVSAFRYQVKAQRARQGG